MKFTKLHIFIILLVALVLCSCLGICSTKEGYTSSSYHNYANYYDNLNDANISATNWSQGLNARVNNPYYNKHDEFHRRYGKNTKDTKDTKNVNNRNKTYSYYDDDLNGGNNDASSYMISTSYKNNNKNYDYYNDANRRERRDNKMFNSVSAGAMNGSAYSYSGSGSGSGYAVKITNESKNDSKNDSKNGVPRNQIPAGQEDLYILKSQALTPICPACPAPPKVNCDEKCSKSKCQPCPPCARCPEPQFNCVKVPNYNTTNLNQNLPIPWMSKL